MPIFVKNYTWNQTENVIIINIPLKNCTASKCNIFTSTNYLKVHHDSHICEIFLYDKINPKSSSCVINDDGLEFCLYKSEPDLWPQVEVNLISKEEKVQIREAAVSEQHEDNKHHVKQLSELRDSLDKQAVRENMKLNELERKAVERNQQIVLKNAIKELYADKPKVKRFVPPKTNKPQQKIADKGAVLPPPRQCAEIEVKFTPRSFPTPSRESTGPDEQEWVKKQTAARKAAGYCPADLSEDEMDPQWIKEKGDWFLQARNYLGAEAAYSHAISLNSQWPALYCNRAAAHLAMGNFHKAIADASKGLELMTPETSSNLTSRARCHVRRAAALCKLGCARMAVPDLVAAVKLCPEDDKLRADLRAAQDMARREDATSGTDSDSS